MPVSIEQDEGRVALDRASSEIDVGLGSILLQKAVEDCLER
jgi:hypothetical protein